MCKNYARDVWLWLSIMLAQLVGAMIGVFLYWTIVAPNLFADGSSFIPASWISPLCPTGVGPGGSIEGCYDKSYRDRSAFLFQLFASFIFINTILVVKNDATARTKDGMLGPATVALALLAGIASSEKQGGACFNPAVAIAQLTWSLPNTTGADHYAPAHYLYVFTIAPLLGGLLAGLFNIWHAKNLQAKAYFADRSAVGAEVAETTGGKVEDGNVADDEKDAKEVLLGQQK